MVYFEEDFIFVDKEDAEERLKMQTEKNYRWKKRLLMVATSFQVYRCQGC
jgi:hypothetical protein